ncbi:MAG TPA: formate/nitrite transporter family protein, partial [Gammaproteobacteria bacterium]|nr:formate/nitrite transporter family protein [Gammaproteobacteria bacterium]
MARKPDTDLTPEAEENSLEGHEHEDAERRAPPRAAVVYETVRREGEYELARPPGSLAWSGLAAGLSMGFSFLAQSLLVTYLPDAEWTHVVSDLGYSVGFMIVILGRQQLFTENTLTPVTELLRHRTLGCLTKVLRLWGIVLVTNTLGAFIFALLIGKTSLLTPEMHRAFADISLGAFATDFPTTLLRGVFAGWLIATLIWLMPFAQSNRVSVIIIITYVIALGQFSHIIAGSVDAFYAVVTGHASWGAFFGRFYVPTLIGNILGGVPLVAVINYAQVEFIR